MRETNNYIIKKLEEKASLHSIWRTWRDVIIEEFWRFIGFIINMETMSLTNLQEYWSRNSIIYNIIIVLYYINSYIPFYSNTFTKNRFNQIFWMLHLKTISTQQANSKTRLQLLLRLYKFQIFKLFHTERANLCGWIYYQIQRLEEEIRDYKISTDIIYYLQLEETNQMGYKSLYNNRLELYLWNSTLL